MPYSVEQEGSYCKIFHPDYLDRPHLVPNGTILLGDRGSVAHGMYVPNHDPNSIDDVDLMGIIVPDERYYLGLKEWGSRGTKEYKEYHWDVVYYELKKMVSLLLQGNPNVLSLVWMRPGDYSILSGLGRRLIENRAIFRGKHVYNAFAGYAHAQLLKMETREPSEIREYLGVTYELKRRRIHPTDQLLPDVLGDYTDCSDWGDEKLRARLSHFQKKGENIGYMGDKRKRLVLEHGYDSKNASHLIRLLRMCIEFLDTGELVVMRPDAKELLEIKRGEWGLDNVKSLSTSLFEEAKAARDRSRLPEKPDYEAAETLVIGILRDALFA